MSKVVRKIQLLIILGIIGMAKISFGQSINFSYTNGSQASFNLNEIRNVTFTNDVMNMNLLDGSVYSWNVSTIGQYEYTNVTSVNNIFLSAYNSLKFNIYPNPSADKINICYNLQQEHNVSIGLFDANGKLVHTIFNGFQKQGEQTVTFKKENLSNGVYLCKIIGKDFSLTKQIILN